MKLYTPNESRNKTPYFGTYSPKLVGWAKVLFGYKIVSGNPKKPNLQRFLE